MKFSKFFVSLLLLSIFSLSLSHAQEKDSLAVKEYYADGPYLFYLPDGGIRVVSVDTGGILKDVLHKAEISDIPFPVVSHSGKHHFEVKLHPISRPVWKYEKSGKIFVLSDPHGNMDCFVSVLRGNNVINENYEWIFGKNHLVINGDVFDRGKDVLPIFWLIYKLEQEAEDAGGKVSFLLGNHEPMILGGDLRYMDKMYNYISEKLGIKYEEMFSASTELGRWLVSRNTIEIIGDDLFVHAGLGEEFLNKNLTVPQVNEEMSRALFMTKQVRNELSELTKFLYGSSGPVWYRGMVLNDEKYNPLHIDILDKILEKYQVKRIIVGHTIFPDVISLYGEKVIGVNVNNKENFENVLGRGLLIENNNTFVIGDKGIMRSVP